MLHIHTERINIMYVKMVLKRQLNRQSKTSSRYCIYLVYIWIDKRVEQSKTLHTASFFSKDLCLRPILALKALNYDVPFAVYSTKFYIGKQ